MLPAVWLFCRATVATFYVTVPLTHVPFGWLYLPRFWIAGCITLYTHTRLVTVGFYVRLRFFPLFTVSRWFRLRLPVPGYGYHVLYVWITHIPFYRWLVPGYGYRSITRRYLRSGSHVHFTHLPFCRFAFVVPLRYHVCVPHRFVVRLRFGSRGLHTHVYGLPAGCYRSLVTFATHTFARFDFTHFTHCHAHVARTPAFARTVWLPFVLRLRLLHTRFGLPFSRFTLRSARSVAVIYTCVAVTVRFDTATFCPAAHRTRY